jgi:hypothetical protein
MIKFIFYYIVIVFVIVSCKDNEDLGEGYNFYYPGAGLDVCTYQGNSICKGYIYNPIVFSDIIEYKYDNKFIIGYSVFNEKDAKILLSFNIQVNDSHNHVFNINDSLIYIKLKGIKKFPYNRSMVDSLFFNNLSVKNTTNMNTFPEDTIATLSNNNIYEKFIEQLMKENPTIIKMRKQKTNYFIIDKTNEKYFIDLSRKEFENISKGLNINLTL